jgi:ATP-dependent Clp protease, protease subunit
MKKPWSITARADGAVDIRLFDVIGEDVWTGGGTTAADFSDELAAAGHVTRIRLIVNSAGGSCFDGICMYNALLSHGAEVTAEVVGLAASIASVIICAASKIAVAETALVMWHNPYAGVVGEAGDLRKLASTLDKMKANMISAYQRHSSLSAAKISALMDEETWFSSAEALENGVAEEIIDPSEDDDEQLAAAFATPILAKFRHVPQQIAARVRSPRPAESQPPASDRERQRLQLEVLRRLP